jgi:hypothetical protein
MVPQIRNEEFLKMQKLAGIPIVEINQFIQDAMINNLEQIVYTFKKTDKVIVDKTKELIALIKSYE